MTDKAQRPSFVARFKQYLGGSFQAFGGNWDAYGVSGRFGDVQSAYQAYSSGRMPTLGLTNFDYYKTLGDGRGSSIIMACVFWLTGAFPEAPLVVNRVQADGEKVPLPKHPIAMLLKRPNPAYPGVLMWHATLMDFLLTGNAYWWKRRDRQDRIAELWWLPSYLIDPRASVENPSIYIDHYAYQPTPKDEPIKLDPEDIVHFRQGLDPRNVRRGISRLSSLFREIFSDEEAGNYTAALLRNFALPGVIISPDVGEADLPQAEADRMKADVKAKFTGDRRGEPIVISQKVKVDRLSMNPAELDLAVLRQIPEQRICGVMGVSPMVIGLGGGEATKTYSNYGESREAAFENTIIPLQRLFAAELDTQLIPDFGDPDDFAISFDYTQVTALQSQVDAMHTRIRADLQAAVITLNQAKEAMKYKQIDDGDVYFIPSSVKVTEEDKLIDQAVTAPQTQAAMRSGIGPDGKPLPPQNPKPQNGQPGQQNGPTAPRPANGVADTQNVPPPQSAVPGRAPATGAGHGKPPSGPLVSDVRSGRKDDSPDYESKENIPAPEDELGKQLANVREQALEDANADLKTFLAQQRERVLKRLIDGLEAIPDKPEGKFSNNGHSNGALTR